MDSGNPLHGLVLALCGLAGGLFLRPSQRAELAVAVAPAGLQEVRECCFTGCSPADLEEKFGLKTELLFLRLQIYSLSLVIVLLLIVIAWLTGILALCCRGAAARGSSYEPSLARNVEAGRTAEPSYSSEAGRSGPASPLLLRDGGR